MLGTTNRAVGIPTPLAYLVEKEKQKWPTDEMAYNQNRIVSFGWVRALKKQEN